MLEVLWWHIATIVKNSVNENNAKIEYNKKWK